MAVLDTERLTLRDFALSDWDALNAIVTEFGVTRYTRFGAWDEAKRRQWFACMAAESERQPQGGTDRNTQQ